MNSKSVEICLVDTAVAVAVACVYVVFSVMFYH